MLENLRQSTGQSDVQVVDADRVIDGEQLIVAADHASKAIERGFNIAKSLAMESLLYAGAENQIEVAIRKVGVGPATRNVGVIIFSEDDQSLVRARNALANSDIGLAHEMTADEWTKARKTTIVSTYELTAKMIRAVRRTHETEREAIKKLVFEKMALLSLEAQKS